MRLFRLRQRVLQPGRPPDSAPPIVAEDLLYNSVAIERLNICSGENVRQAHLLRGNAGSLWEEAHIQPDAEQNG
jgi:hypothetical protein